MFDKIRRLGTETAIYGISTILGRFLTFILTPIYTHLLIPDNLGIVATVYSYIAFFNVIYGYGMEGAFMKYLSTLEIGDRKQNFTVPFVSVGIVSVILTGMIVLQSGPLARLIHVPESFSIVVAYAGWILLLDAIAIIPFASLRMERKAKTFVAVRLASIVLNVVLNIVFLVQYNMGIEGIFLSGVISSGFTLLLLSPHIFSHLTLVPAPGLLPALLRFGLPSVPAGLASMMIQVIDRPILESISGKAAVGIYQANYRLGIFMMLIVSMFDFAWRPFFLSLARDPEAKSLFARVLTYYCLAATVIFLLLSFFLSDIVTAPIFVGRPLFAPAYWSGLSIVPLVLLGYLFLGVYNNLLAGIYIEKRTGYLPAVTFLGAAVNVVANYLLIPSWGLTGAAFATFAAYAVMAVALYVVVHRIYPVPYEWARITKIGIAAAAVFGIYALVQIPGAELLWKAALLFAFVALMYAMKFFIPSELAILSRLFSRRPVLPTNLPPDSL
jgi:O-antigen/teichoic acid export membrane protein